MVAVTVGAAAADWVCVDTPTPLSTKNNNKTGIQKGIFLIFHCLLSFKNGTLVLVFLFSPINKKRLFRNLSPEKAFVIPLAPLFSKGVFVHLIIGLIWLGLAWLGLAWLGLAWLGLQG